MRFLLDEHLSPEVARRLRRRGIDAVSPQEWQGGACLQQPDEAILRAARDDGRILVTYDVHSLPLILKEWAESGEGHAGVVLVSAATIAPNDYGRLVEAVEALARRDQGVPWTNRVLFLSRNT